MTETKQIALSDDRQVTALEMAKEQVAEDVDAIDDDLRIWGDEPTDGEIIRVLADAYTGRLSIESSDVVIE